jgi:hypothetical protein
LTPKERVYATLDHKEPDLVPSGEFATDFPTIEAAIGRKTYWRARVREAKALWAGERDAVVESKKRDIVEFTRKMGLEMVPVRMVPSVDREFEKPERIGHNMWKDKNGNVMKVAEGSQVIITVKNADEDRDYTEDDFVYEEPEVDESMLELIRYVVQELGETHFIFARSWDGSYALPGGLRRGLRLCLTKPEVVKKAVEVNLKRSIFMDRIFAREGVDALAPGADYGYNKGTFLRPEIIEDLYYPAMKRQCESAHALGLKILKHSCGNNWPIMDQFVRAGYDGYQSIQPTAGMEIAKLKELYGDRIALWGGVSCERLAGGTVEETRALTQYALEHAAPGGGFICASSHSLLVGTKFENYCAMLDEIRRHGRYPLD